MIVSIMIPIPISRSDVPNEKLKLCTTEVAEIVCHEARPVNAIALRPASWERWVVGDI